MSVFAQENPYGQSVVDLDLERARNISLFFGLGATSHDPQTINCVALVGGRKREAVGTESRALPDAKKLI